MPPRIALVLLALGLGFGLAGAVAQAPSKSDDADLDYRIVPLPASVFSAIDPTNKEGFRKPEPGVHPMGDGRMGAFDVREVLGKYGVSSPAGTLAFYDEGALVVRNTAPNLALIDHLFENRPREAGTDVVSVRISTYECALPASKGLLPWDELTYADIIDLPKESVKLVDCNLITGKSGQRFTSDSMRDRDYPAPAGEGRDANSSLFHGDGTGSSLELEAVVGPDNETVDLNISYSMRAKVPGAGNNGLAEMRVVTSFTMWNDYPLVVHSAPVDGEPGKYFVVVAWVHLAGVNDFKLPPPDPGVKPGVVALTPKAPGLPPPMLFKRYKVPPGFLSTTGPGVSLLSTPPASIPAGNAKGNIDAMKYLKDAGVQFPPGSHAIFDPVTNTLIIINTEENLDLVDRIVDAGDFEYPTIISVELSAYECDFSDAKDTAAIDKLTFAELEKKPRDSVKVIGCVSLITKSGLRAAAVDSSGPDTLKAMDFQQPPVPRIFQAGQTGTELDAEPIVGPDGKKIDVNAGFEIRMQTGAEGGKEIVEIKSTAKFTSESGDPRVVMVSSLKNHKGKYIVVVMRMRVLSPGGWNAKFTNLFIPPSQPQVQAPAPASPQTQ